MSEEEVLSTKQMMADLKRRVKYAGGQAALANDWGISPQSISNCLTGTKLPSPKILEKLRLDPDKTIHYRYKRIKK